MPQYVLAQFTAFLATALNMLLNAYWWILLIAVILSWVNADPRNGLVRFFYSVTEPVLYQVRRRLPFVVMWGIDFSPLVVLLAIMFVQMVIVSSLYRLAAEIVRQAARPVLIG